MIGAGEPLDGLPVAGPARPQQGAERRGAAAPEPAADGPDPAGQPGRSIPPPRRGRPAQKRGSGAAGDPAGRSVRGTPSQQSGKTASHDLTDRFPSRADAGGPDESFGARLRRLREQAGLSQTQLAKGAVSASYLSHLEADARTPSARTLTVLARRLGVPVAVLRDGEDRSGGEAIRLALAYAELALLNGEPLTALADFRRVAADAGADRVDRVSARLGAARALEVAGELEAAIVELRSLVAAAHAEPAAVPLLPVAMALSRCYRVAGDLRRSIQVAEDALVRCDELGLTGSYDHVRLASTLMQAHTELGDLAHAGVLARELVRAVDAGGDEIATASAYWNASLVEDERGHHREALRLAERALAAFTESGDQAATARLRVAYGWLLMRQQPPQVDLAMTVLQQARRRLAELGTADEVASCCTEIGRAWLLRGGADRALDSADEALVRLAGGRGVEAALAQLVRGRALRDLGRHDEAQAAFTVAVEVARSAAASRQAAAVLRELGEIHLADGRPELAADAFRGALDSVAVRPMVPGLGALARSPRH